MQFLEQSSHNNEPMSTNTVLMIQPYNFRSNEMTAQNNYYQQHNIQSQMNAIHLKSIKEFDDFHQLLLHSGVNAIVVQDDGKNDTPDSVFPNNWVSFHQKNFFNLYPMFAANRRLERKIDIFQGLKNNGIDSKLLHNYTHYQEENLFLEGTGSMILDRKHRVAYAAISPRTSEKLFLLYCSQNGYRPCYFKAYQTVSGKRELIYHTNVMMWIGEGIACICLRSIDNQSQRQLVLQELLKTSKEVIELSQDQISNFAGNCLMMSGKDNEKVIAMSRRAHNSYTSVQIAKLESYGKIISSDLDSIQRYGGGSARCMLAQIF